MDSGFFPFLDPDPVFLEELLGELDFGVVLPLAGSVGLASTLLRELSGSEKSVTLLTPRGSTSLCVSLGPQQFLE